MADTRPLASLSAGLLARKGQARPAMRPQPYAPSFDPTPRALEDLGWNDMGDAPPATVPEVHRQQQALAAEFAPPPPSPLPAVAEVTALPPVPVSRATGKPRTAFTLRLDPARHLKLRLACATRALSAQKLVVAALDQLLAGMPDLDGLADRLADDPRGSSNGDPE